MRLDLNFRFTDFEGKIIEGIPDTAAKTVAKQLASTSDGIPAIKAMDWALKFHNDGAIEIDRTDSKLLEDFITKSPLTNLAKAPILLAIQKVED